MIRASFQRLKSAKRAAIASVLSVALVLPAIAPAAAQGRSVPIVRDAEIEALVTEYARPILKAAGLGNSGIRIVLVNDPSFNAFVAGNRIFVNTGALMTAETPNEIIGVLAHESGHIAGGHQQRLRDQIARAQTAAVVAGLLGMGAAVGGAASGTNGLGQAGMGMAMGSSEVARRSVLGYQRTEEITADRSAMRYLEATGQSGKGMLATFQRFQSGLALAGTRVDPYQISHPMPRERIANLTELAQSSPHYNQKDPAELQQRHDRMRAKIAAYTQDQRAASRLFRNDRSNPAAAYGDAFTTFLYGNPAAALQKVDALIKTMPKNPYLYELRGEVLMRGNRPAEAANAFATAVKLDPNRSGILQVAYGQALLATGKPAALKQATVALQQGLARDREYINGYKFLAQAYGQAGSIGEAELATAEGHYYSGNYKDAMIFAARAQQRLKRGSPGWVRAQDIISSRTKLKK
ncbi:M48 family metallopeptidase [Tianweitania sp. BSSL-BM11]|uniref:M48 family metallopeptidase n=1 Tax=Tianweitania aestuarii TaxID=2814886 RepID=A0ABS5RU14_9HYPH|nr:M48 family metalloprotease [Tianweitania aestuarii]MBS9720546.1 M48 family metallopeptidase [Tianweitania aestuarii]